MDVLTPFEGPWRLYRQIEDRLAGTHLVFEGTASLERDGHGLTYCERGLWTTSDWGPTRATRTYLWRAEGDQIRVDFEDGRPFHGFLATGPRAESRHACAPDHYAVEYSLDLPTCWEAVWHVLGPRKDYVSRTRYDRDADRPLAAPQGIGE